MQVKSAVIVALRWDDSDALAKIGHTYSLSVAMYYVRNNGKHPKKMQVLHLRNMIL